MVDLPPDDEERTDIDAGLGMDEDEGASEVVSATTPAIPPAPKEEDEGPDPHWEYFALYTAVRNALYALPSYFKAELNIAGIAVADLQTFNTSLGATIESQTVETLNSMRQIWDKEGKYADYTFVRQSQQFPDVILKATSEETEPQILMGIELKGWYVMAREGEPSFRFGVTPAVCAPWDLLVVVPWALSNVISGTPRLFRPYVVPSRFAAKLRNWHWEHKRGARGRKDITLSTMDRFYPAKSDAIADVPVDDNGSNFGRYARAGLMNEYIKSLYEDILYGITLGSWQKFFRLFSPSITTEAIAQKLNRMADDLTRMRPPLTTEAAVEIIQALERMIMALTQPSSLPSHPRTSSRQSTSEADFIDLDALE